MNAALPLPIDPERLCRALRPLGDPPQAPGWNAAEIADLLPPGQPCRSAAVLVPVVCRGTGATVLFTRRTEQLRQHAGQISFPGGGIERGDVDAIAAALRETREETGIEPAFVRPIGYLDSFETVSGFCVAPVVGFVREGFRLAPDPVEVAEVFEVPLDHILAPGRLRRVHLDWRGRSREIYEFDYHGRRIWGATAAMLLNLVRRLEAVS